MVADDGLNLLFSIPLALCLLSICWIVQYALVSVFARCRHSASRDWAGFQPHSPRGPADGAKPVPEHLAWRRQNLAMEQMADVLDR